MTPEERQIAIQKIEALPAQLEQLIAGADDAKLNKTYGQGKWSARQVIHHIADSHLFAFIRTRFIATVDHPTIQPYDQEVWAQLPDAKSGPVAPSLEIIKGMHARWVEFLRSLPKAAWDRTGYHPERGVISLDDLVRIYAGHGAKHLEHIRAAIEA
ncbi:MAG: DinB family protein [Bryobacteraceae bacterium]